MDTDDGVRGGQGRSADDVRGDAITMMSLIRFLLLCAAAEIWFVRFFL